MADDGRELTRASDGTITGVSGLTEKQALFVRKFIELGGALSKAAEAAGYADPPSSAHYLMRQPHILAAIRAEREREIQTKGATTAWATMLDLMTNPKYTGAVKFQAAKWTLEAAGHGLDAHRAALGLPHADKPLSEMSLEEIETFIVAGRRAVDTLKEEKARVIEGEVVQDARDSARNSGDEDSQVIDLPSGG